MVFHTEKSKLELKGSNVYEFSNTNSNFITLMKKCD